MEGVSKLLEAACTRGGKVAIDSQAKIAGMSLTSDIEIPASTRVCRSRNRSGFLIWEVPDSIM